MLRLTLLFICCFGLLNAEENPSLMYISQYKEIAISEMHKSGIPASIKMAQALLESGAGRSTLALEANNHFGIKCGGSWTGKTFYRKDDDYNDKGKLIESCFRKFSAVEESYTAHSDFLKNQKRYAFLFDYKPTDYKKWAHGLKKAGYATDNAYPKKLIQIIEKYELYALDNEEAIYVESTPKKKEQLETDNSGFEYESSSEINPSDEFVASNDQKRTRRSNKRKKRKDNKRESKNRHSSPVSHIVLEDQSISEIAMIYDISETGLRLRNRLPKNGEPLAGEKIYLRKKISIFKRPKFSRVPNKNGVVVEEEYIF